MIVARFCPTPFLFYNSALLHSDIIFRFTLFKFLIYIFSKFKIHITIRTIKKRTIQLRMFISYFIIKVYDSLRNPIHLRLTLPRRNVHSVRRGDDLIRCCLQ